MAKSVTDNRVFGVLVLLMAIYAAFFFARPINLATADLGRHITNGKLILDGVTDVLYQNHYSYTEPEQEFVNHHWGSGVLFHLIHSLSGFNGLSIAYILLTLLAFLFMGLGSAVKNHRSVVALIMLSVIPLVAYRVEVRPEGFSYAILAAFFYLFSKFKAQEISFKKLLIPILILQLVWVNLHIFFFLGIVVAGAFWFDALIRKHDQGKQLGITLGSMILVSLINPHFHLGLLAPLTIFNEYGYMVAENQTILFMHERFGNPELYHFEVFGVLLILLVGYLLFKRVWKEHIPEILLSISFLILAAMAVRGIPLFALFFVPIGAAVGTHFVNGLNFKVKESTLKTLQFLTIGLLIIFIPLKGTYASAQKGVEGLGLIEGIDKTGKFLKRNKVPGPIFNNYDFGSYLVYFFEDKEKVFVDNRPEAYSVAFFDSIYKPMQENEVIWKEKSAEYGLNLIVFYRHDNTPWAQPFLITRTQDPEWVPIYVDEVSLVMIKNLASNKTWIDKYALPREMFSGVPNN